MFIFNNFLDEETCLKYKKRIEYFYTQSESKYGADLASKFDSNLRTIDITNDPIGFQVKKFLELQLRFKLQFYQVQLQAWPISETPSKLHSHTEKFRAQGDYNSLIYLNDDFEGGEFYTEHGLSLKPKTGTLTFFDGKNVMHGVKSIALKNRYTIIIWWKDTMLDPENIRLDNKLYS